MSASLDGFCSKLFEKDGSVEIHQQGEIASRPWHKTAIAWLAAVASTTYLAFTPATAHAASTVDDLIKQPKPPEKTRNWEKSVHETYGGVIPLVRYLTNCEVKVVDGVDLVEKAAKRPLEEVVEEVFRNARAKYTDKDVSDLANYLKYAGPGVFWKNDDGNGPFIIISGGQRQDGLNAARFLLDDREHPELFKGVNVQKINLDYGTLTYDLVNAFTNYHESAHAVQMNFARDAAHKGVAELYQKIPPVNETSVKPLQDQIPKGMRDLIEKHYFESAADVYATLKMAEHGNAGAMHEIAKLRLLKSTVFSQAEVQKGYSVNGTIAYNSYRAIKETLRLTENVASGKWAEVERDLNDMEASYTGSASIYSTSNYKANRSQPTANLFLKKLKTGGLKELDDYDKLALTAFITSRYCMSPVEAIAYRSYILNNSVPSGTPNTVRSYIENQFRISDNIIDRGRNDPSPTTPATKGPRIRSASLDKN